VTGRWWVRPLVAVVLGALLFVVFVGTSQATVVKGQPEPDSRLNILGLVLAVAGIAVAVGTLRRRPERATVIAAVLAGPDEVRMIEADARATVPSLLTAEELAVVEEVVRGADQPPPCSAEADAEFMVSRADIARDDRKRLVLQTELFRARFG
jgi:hypothetical protein